MFTGIVHGVAEVKYIKQNKSIITYGMKFSSFLLKELKCGASVANNGCCLTVKYIDKNIVFFDVIQTTLEHTNFVFLKIGDRINIERSLKFGDEIGGHLVSGHIITTARIYKIIILKNNFEICFLVEKQSIMQYILHKGFIAIDGISLTVNKIENNMFTINVIPETIVRTNLKNKIVGYTANIEVDYYTRILIDNMNNIVANCFSKSY